VISPPLSPYDDPSSITFDQKNCTAGTGGGSMSAASRGSSVVPSEFDCPVST
jgi:hypothetical protein